MKYLFFAVLLTSSFAFSQDHHNHFILRSGQITWQIKLDTVKFTALLNAAKQSGSFSAIETKDNTFYGLLSPFSADYKGAGYKEMNVPVYISRSSFIAWVVVENTGAGITITVSRIMLKQKYDDGLSKMGEESALEDYAAGDGKFKKAFTKSPSEILGFTLSKLFSNIF